MNIRIINTHTVAECINIYSDINTHSRMYKYYSDISFSSYRKRRTSTGTRYEKKNNFKYLLHTFML